MKQRPIWSALFGILALAIFSIMVTQSAQASAFGFNIACIDRGLGGDLTYADTASTDEMKLVGLSTETSLTTKGDADISRHLSPATLVANTYTGMIDGLKSTGDRHGRSSIVAYMDDSNTADRGFKNPRVRTTPAV